jgi:hypothetical protein
MKNDYPTTHSFSPKKLVITVTDCTPRLSRGDHSPKKDNNRLMSQRNLLGCKKSSRSIFSKQQKELELELEQEYLD